MITRLYDNDVYTGEGNPPSNLNPSKLGSIYVNRITGQRWFCRDITTNRNQWVPSAEGFGSYHYYGINALLMNSVNPDARVTPEWIGYSSFFRPAIIYQNRTGFPLIFYFCKKIPDYYQSEFYISSDSDFLRRPNLSGQWWYRNQAADCTLWSPLAYGSKWKMTNVGSRTTSPVLTKLMADLTNNSFDTTWTSAIIPPDYYFALESDAIGTKGNDGSQYSNAIRDPNAHEFVFKKNVYNTPILNYDYRIALHYDFSNYNPNEYKRMIVDINKKALYKVHNYYDDSGTDREGNNTTYRLAGFE